LAFKCLKAAKITSLRQAFEKKMKKNSVQVPGAVPDVGPSIQTRGRVAVGEEFCGQQ
jgi:hypothetical protein